MSEKLLEVEVFESSVVSVLSFLYLFIAIFLLCFNFLFSSFHEFFIFFYSGFMSHMFFLFSFNISSFYFTLGPFLMFFIF